MRGAKLVRGKRRMALNKARQALEQGQEVNVVVLEAIRKALARAPAAIDLHDVLRTEEELARSEAAMTTQCLIYRFYLEANLLRMTLGGTGPPYAAAFACQSSKSHVASHAQRGHGAHASAANAHASTTPAEHSPDQEVVAMRTGSRLHNLQRFDPENADE